MDVRWHPGARSELGRLDARERAALLNAEEKLVALGTQLGFPHSSAVQGTQLGLRELRPRRGSSAWRALYRRVGDALVILAVAPEAQSNPRGFRAAVTTAETRLAEIEED